MATKSTKQSGMSAAVRAAQKPVPVQKVTAAQKKQAQKLSKGK